MWGTQVSGVPSLKRKAGGQRHHLLQAVTKEVRHKQKDADGGDPGLQVPISRRGINKSAVRDDQAGGGGDSNYKLDSNSEQSSHSKQHHHNISPYGTSMKSRSFQDHQFLPK